MRPFTFIIAIASTAAALTGCSSSNSGPSGSTQNDGGGSGSTPTFTEVYSQIISNSSVGCLNCHVPGQIGVTDGTLDMSSQATAYTNLVGVAAGGSGCKGDGTRVVAGDAATSLLYMKVAGTQTCGSRMPLDGTPLSQAQITEIQDWIAGGALND